MKRVRSRGEFGSKQIVGSGRAAMTTAFRRGVASLGLLATVASAGGAGVPPQIAATDGGCAAQLLNLQQCVDTAALASLRGNASAPLDAVTTALRSRLRTDSGNALYYRSYWLAYADYRLAQVAVARRQPAQGRNAALEGERILDGLATKSPDSYALQSLTVYMQFAILPKSEIGTLIGKSMGLRAKLTGIDSPRTLYARALSDWYTPKEYGGGQVAEKLLRQALAAPDEPASQLKPTWGRDDCASLLVMILKATNRAAEARTLQDSWARKQPNSIAFAVGPRS